MTKCPRCHSSMLIDYSDTHEGFQRTWKCIGCGREIFRDPEQQRDDDRQLQQVKVSSGLRSL